MDPDVRKLWKSFPWIGWAVAVLFGGLIVRYIISQTITIGGSGKWQSTMKQVTWEDSPVEFFLVLLGLAALLCGTLFYCRFRMQRRNQYRREDGELE